jgi:hypothetical protein
MRQRVARYKILVFYLIMIGLTVGVSFSLIEYGLARYYHSTEDQISYTTFDPILGWRLNPGRYWIKPAHTFREHLIQINEYGLRNRPITTQRDLDRRIVILGDSFAFASAIEQESIFPVLLENLLNKTGHYEVINAGVPGYGTAQEMLFMKDLADKRIVGDMYVLMIFLNDILDNLRLSEYGRLRQTQAQPGYVVQQDGELKLVHTPEKEYSPNVVPPKRTKFFTLEVMRSRLSTFLQTKPGLVSLLSKFGFEATLWRMPSLIYGWYLEDILDSGVPLTKALLKAIQAEAGRTNAVLLVGVIPSPLQVYPGVYDPILQHALPNDRRIEAYINDRLRPQRIISEMCRSLEIPMLDLHPILMENNDKELFIPADGHLSKDGHAIVAQRLGQFITEHASSLTTSRGKTAR